MEISPGSPSFYHMPQLLSISMLSGAPFPSTGTILGKVLSNKIHLAQFLPGTQGHDASIPVMPAYLDIREIRGHSLAGALKTPQHPD